MEKEERVNFYDLFPKTTSKIEIIVTFWAILEMYKYGKISIMQHSFFGDIYLFKKAKTPDMIAFEQEMRGDRSGENEIDGSDSSPGSES